MVRLVVWLVIVVVEFNVVALVEFKEEVLDGLVGVLSQAIVVVGDTVELTVVSLVVSGL
jgi:hypothetical protein